MSCNNSSGICAFGNSWWWIIVLVIIFVLWNGNSNGCGCSCGTPDIKEGGIAAFLYVTAEKAADR